MLVDSHCHIPVVCKDPAGPTAAEIVDRAGAAGVSHMLCVGVDLPSLSGVMQVIEAHPNVFGSVGVHPNTDKDPCPDVDTLVGLADHQKVVAVGETGLDYCRSPDSNVAQRTQFRKMCSIAVSSSPQSRGAGRIQSPS